MKKTQDQHTHFPWKKSLIASLVIILCFLMVLGLLYAIINVSKLSDKSWIFATVWACILGAFLIGYWIYQIVQFHQTRKDEKK
jgi:VIT1/CCC1 family predicted Fe2+/Mn2+ transporter